MKFKTGDKIIINHPKSDKHGLKGEVRTILINGAMIKLGDNHFTAVQFSHLIKEKNGKT